MVVLAAFLHLLILAGALYDTARLCASRHGTARLRRGRGPGATEKRLVAQRLHGRIDAATYRARMCELAEGRRPVRRRRPGQALSAERPRPAPRPFVVRLARAARSLTGTLDVRTKPGGPFGPGPAR
ncbi:hypothetical protein M2160_001153 [Streptomyces sp. SAI-117]|nr:hypothetical protein [Streptomyces sp. SAI-117]